MIFPCTMCNEEFDINILNDYYICVKCENYINQLNKEEFNGTEEQYIFIDSDGYDTDAGDID